METHAIIYNPIAGKEKRTKKDIEYMKKCLDELNIPYQLHETGFAGHAIKLANKLAKEGFRVIGAGGDGTCNETMNGVIQSGIEGALCGFIPMGTGNDIPGAIGIRPDIKRACEIIAEGHTGKVDIGFAKTDAGVERYFLGIGSQGFDAEVTKRTNEAKKHFEGTANYVVQVLKALLPWKNKQVKVIMDNNTYEGFANCLAVGNGPSYGGWMYICQTAQIDDGVFDISIVDIGKFKLLRHFNRMYKATLVPHPNIHTFRSKKVRVEMLEVNGEEPYLCQVDGEVLGNLPVTYECIKDGCEFIKPEINEVAEAFKEKYGKYYWECESD
ncbi:MAG: diacylglycerol/lipid kinase family protein [Promethearchaeota archaeon]